MQHPSQRTAAPAPEADGPTSTPASQLPEPGRSRRRLSWWHWALAALLTAAVGGSYALGLPQHLWEYLRSHMELFRAQVQQHLLLALLLIFLTYVAVTALSLPVAAVLSLTAGALFDRWLGTVGVSLMVSLAATLGATLAFLSSRYLFRDWVQQRFGERLAPLDRGIEQDGPYYLFTLRLVPAFPFFLINLGMGLTRMRAWTFAWVSLLGMLPGTFLYVNFGRELGRIDSPRGLLSPSVLLSLALLGVVPLLFRKLLRRRLAEDTSLKR